MGIRTAILRDELGIITYILEQLEFEIVAFYGMDSKALEMCQHNLKWNCIHTDSLDGVAAGFPDVDLIIAQLPYHAFELTKMNSGFKERQEEVYQYLEVIAQKRPKIILFEIPPKIAKMESFREFLSNIQKLNYRFSYRMCDIGKMTGLPVNEKKVYLVGTLPEIGKEFLFPEMLSNEENTTKLSDICVPLTTVDSWYFQVDPNMVDFSSENEEGLYCWKTSRYIEKQRLDWNPVKVPLIYKQGTLHKITHREIARLKGIPDAFYLNSSNKGWLYRRLMYGSNGIFIRRLAEAIRDLLDETGVRNWQMVNSYRFEQLLYEYLQNKKVHFRSGFSEKEAYPDFVMDMDTEKLFIEAKWYNSNVGVENKVTRACQRLHQQQERHPGNYILMTGNLVEDSTKHICYDLYHVMIWDVRNLLWMFGELPEIKNEFVSMLNYTIGDLLPEKPRMSFKDSDAGKPEFEKQKRKEKISFSEEEATEAESSVSYSEKLERIQPGQEFFSQYEKIASEILEYVLGDYLTLWEKQTSSNNGLYRFDLCCKIKHGHLPEFFDTIKTFFHTKYIVFEFKNYEEAITQKEIYTTEKYLYQKALRGVAIIVSRKGADKNALSAARGCLRENGKLILCLSDRDLLEMIKAKEDGERSTADFLGDMLDAMLIHLEK